MVFSVKLQKLTEKNLQLEVKQHVYKAISTFLNEFSLVTLSNFIFTGVCLSGFASCLFRPTRKLYTWKTKWTKMNFHALPHSCTRPSRGTCLYILGVEVQGVGDFSDIDWFVVCHALLLLWKMHNLLHWFLLIIGPDLQHIQGVKKCFKKRHVNATQTWRSDRSSLMCQTFFRDRNSCNENSYMLHQWPEIYNSMRLLNETGMSCWHTRSWWHIAQATAKQHSFSLIIFGPISNPWCCQHMGQSITPMTDFWPHIILQRCFWTHICKDLPHVFQQLF